MISSMNASIITFEVTSAPNQLVAGSSNYFLESGKIDMSGFKEAYSIFNSKLSSR